MIDTRGSTRRKQRNEELRQLQKPLLLNVRQRSDRSVSSTISTNNQKRRVRFSNSNDDHVTTFVRYVEPITDPDELASMHSSAIERRLYKADARYSVRKASIDCHDLIVDLHRRFFGKSSGDNVELMLGLLLEWCQNEEHRGLEKIIMKGARSHCDATKSKQWAQFLALADCVVVYGMAKVMEDAAIRKATSC